jgi:uncharacterized protein
MSLHFRTSHFLPITSASLSSLFALTALGATGCAAPEHIVVSTDATATGITVSGSGDVSAKPDIGHVQLGVEARAATAELSSSEANAQMTAIVAALKSIGIAEKDLRTNRISLYRDFQPQPPPPPAAMPAPVARPMGKPGAPPPFVPPTPAPTNQGYEVFRASGSVEVTLRDLDKAGQVIATATKAGSNDIGNFEMSIEDPKPLEKQARDKAMADARARAEQLAKLAGVTLGPVVSIQEGGGTTGGHFPQMAMMKSEAAYSSMPVERGEVKVARQVQIRFAIGK